MTQIKLFVEIVLGEVLEELNRAMIHLNSAHCYYFVGFAFRSASYHRFSISD